MNDERGTVRLRTQRLAVRMDQAGLTAHRLHLLSGGPTKRTINRWLSRGAGTADGVVPARADHVDAIADALGVLADELIDSAGLAEDDDHELFMRLAAALGPRVYPDLMSHLGIHGDVDALNATRRLERVSSRRARLQIHRFTRWAYCLEILQDGTELPERMAEQALLWCRDHDVTARRAPELHCMCQLRLGAVEEALKPGVAWMKRASGQGVFAEVAWVGQRLMTALEGVRVPLTEARTEAVVLLGRALRLLGRPEQALAVETEALLSSWLRADALQRARVEIEIAKTNHVLGQVYAGKRAVEQAIDLLHSEVGPDEAGSILMDALQEHAYLCERLGDFEAAASSLERQRQLARRLDGAPRARHFRLLGLAALDRGSVREALEHFLVALDVADSHGDEREGGIGSLNVALGLALSGRAEQASAYFERATGYVSSGEVGPYAVGLVHMNFGEFELEQRRLGSARRLLRIARDQLRKAGHFPGLRARCAGLMAEVEVASGDLPAAREEARAAYRDALVADNPMWVALALVSYALAHQDQPSEATQWSDAALEAMARLPADSHRLERLAVERRAAQVLLGSDREPEARARLGALQQQAARLGLETERRVIERLLA